MAKPRIHLLIVLIIVSGWQLNVRGDWPTLHFEQIGSDKGIVDTRAQSICEDSSGFIWFGTPEVLYRFDGYESKSYYFKPGDNTSLLSNNISVLYCDSTGKLWIGSSQGLQLYQSAQDNFRTIELAHPTDNNPAILALRYSNGFLYVGTNSSGLIRLSVGNFTPEPLLVGDSNNNCKNISSLAFTNDNRLLIGTNCRYISILNINTNHQKIYWMKETFSKSNSVRSLYLSNDGIVWAGVFGAGVYHLRPDAQQFEKAELPSPFSVLTKFTTDIIEYNPNKILLSTDDQGLFMIDLSNRNWVQYTTDISNKNSISGNALEKMYLDSRKNLWISGSDGDINVLYHNKTLFNASSNFTGFQKALLNKSILTLMEDRDGNIWAGTDNHGIFVRHRDGRIKHYLDFHGLASNKITCFLESGSGHIWLGTYAGGLGKYNPSTDHLQVFRHNPNDKQSLSSDMVWSLAEDKNGNIWVGTNGFGLCKYIPDLNHFVRFNKDWDTTGPTDNYIFNICFDVYGDMIMGTAGKGLNIKKNKETIFTELSSYPGNNKSIPGNCIYQVVFDTDSNMWVATDYGLALFDKVLHEFISQPQIDNNFLNIRSIVFDNNKNLWYTSNNKICRISYSPNQEDMIKLVPSVYDHNNGLSGADYKRGSVLKTTSGFLLFGSRKGLDIVIPEFVKQNTSQPKIVISHIKVFDRFITPDMPYDNKKNSTTQKITLHHSDKIVSIGFKVLHYTAPQKNSFAYRIVGLSENWTVIEQGNPTLTFTNLPSGKKQLEVKAANCDKIWSSPEIILEIYVKPPWWRTWWAYFGYFAISALLVYLIRKTIQDRLSLKQNIYLEKIKNEQRFTLISKERELADIKLRFFMNISHEFRTPLTLIIGPLEELFSQINDRKLKEQVQIIYRNAQRLYRLINQLLDMRRIELGVTRLHLINGNFFEYLSETFNSFDYLAKKQKITYTLQLPDGTNIVPFDRDIVEKILYNTISNAFKYTPEGGRIILSVTPGSPGSQFFRPINPELLSNQIFRIDSHSIRLFNSKNFGIPTDWLEITVTDSGIGIPSEKLPLIFDRFYRIEDSGISKISGTGIGLSLTREMVLLHRGEIIIESRPGMGTSICIAIPATPSFYSDSEFEEEYQSSPSEMYPHITRDLKIQDTSISQSNNEADFYGSKETLLLADDNIELLKYLQTVLESDYNILFSNNGTEAFDIASEQMPDLVISDVMMPQMDGIELSKKLKSDERTSHIPIVLLTARTATESQAEGLYSGADAYITKPFDKIILKATIVNLLENRKKLRERFSTDLKFAPESLTLPTTEKTFLRKIFDIIENKMDDPNFDADALARISGYSRSQLYQKLKSISGKTVSDCIKTLRLKKAAVLLKQKQMNITEISYATGFKTQPHFTRCFTEHFGLSPSEYQKRSHSNCTNEPVSE